MNEHLLKSASIGAVVRLVSKMPFAENARGVASGLKDLSQSSGLEGKSFPFENRVRDTVFELMSAGKERAARGRAGWADVKISEAHPFIVQAIDIRSIKHGMPVTGHVPITLVIRENKYNVRAAPSN